MKYLIILGLLLIGCASEKTMGERRHNNAVYVAERMSCVWSKKYDVCVCISGYISGDKGYMTWVPDRVCKKCDKTKCSIK